MSNFNYIDKNLAQVIENWTNSDTKDTRMQIFNKINKIAKGILVQDYALNALKSVEVSFDYSLDLLDRILSKNVNWKALSNAEFVRFIQLDIKKFIDNGFWSECLDRTPSNLDKIR